MSLKSDPQIPNTSKGFGFITFLTKDSATSAVEKLNGQEMALYPGIKVGTGSWMLRGCGARHGPGRCSRCGVQVEG